MSMIASHIGKPLFADRATSSMNRLSYARVYIEVDVDCEMLSEIQVEYANGGSVIQRVEYEWVPQICKKCRMFGHLQEKPNCQSNRTSASEREAKSQEHEVAKSTDLVWQVVQGRTFKTPPTTTVSSPAVSASRFNLLGAMRDQAEEVMHPDSLQPSQVEQEEDQGDIVDEGRVQQQVNT
ncbi:hypothetical protein LIER_16858 [Lithospermum erythrorhizon]|uniref:Zinc knuckle CX2CX4HX4C domain-containing protein n=1 Tax=Lithospermum erythrorhizon TaxID=34254 RepID=A0AAV3Q9L3_LITER